MPCMPWRILPTLRGYYVLQWLQPKETEHKENNNAGDHVMSQPDDKFLFQPCRCGVVEWRVIRMSKIPKIKCKICGYIVWCQ